MGEMGVKSIAELHRRLPEGEDRIAYETVRLLSNGDQRNTRDPRVPRDLALILDVAEDQVRAALKIEPNFGIFELPPRAQGLAPSERKVVLSVVDAIITAKRGGTGWLDAGGSEDPEPAAGPDGPNDPSLVIDDEEELITPEGDAPHPQVPGQPGTQLHDQ